MLIYLLALIDDDGDRDKLAQIFDQYHIQMEKVAKHILPELKDAEDAVQNAFVQVIKHFEKVSTIPSEELLFWLIAITKNEALMIQRKRKRIVQLEDWNSFAASVNNDLDYNELVALILRMPQTYRAVLEMKLLLGYTDREIAHRLGISETAVSTRASRGRRLLRERILEEGFHL